MRNSIDKACDILLSLDKKKHEPNDPFAEYLEIINSKEKVLSRFQPILANTNALTESDFRDFLSFKHNCHWTGLERPTKHTCDDMPRLRAGLERLFDETISITDRIDSLVDKGEYSVRGLGPGILSALLLIRYPNKYSVWNGKSEGAMHHLKIWPKFNRGISKGERYRILNDICLQVSEKTKVDLWTLDGLWHVANELCRRENERAFSDFESVERAYFEGTRKEFTGIRVERDIEARNKCIELLGEDCFVCGFNFYQTYGELGLGFIHVHHREDLAMVDGQREIDPRKDLAPVCPNCHAMLHKGAKPCRSIDELKGIIEFNKSN